ncbi:MAG: hypothetical protein P8N76_28730 [Pirellulaceae bacterium]|nr:hypothetical protein [Pirellulaceae bacterium]
MQHACPIDPSSLSRWRKPLRADRLEKMLEVTLQVAMKSGELKPLQLTCVNVDTTVQEKAIASGQKNRTGIKRCEKGTFKPLSTMHLSRADAHADVGNVSVIVLTGSATSLVRSQDWPRSFLFRSTPMIVSDLPTLPRRR